MTSPLKSASATVAQLSNHRVSLRAPQAELETRWATWLTSNRLAHARAVQWRLWVLIFGVLALGTLALLAFRMNGGVA